MQDSPDLPRTPSIGVFDSGVGGLSILRALAGRIPEAPLVYVGDVAHAPYGTRRAEEILARSSAVTAWLVAQGATLVVVACNTATVTAIEALRLRWPDRAFVGVEPGVKPAAARSAARRIAVMATPATVASARLRRLVAHHAADTCVHLEPCAGLATAIEAGVLDGPVLDELLAPHCDAILRAGVDTVVLGCTHYAFVDAAIRRRLGPSVTVLDTAAAIAERTAALWDRMRPAVAPIPRRRVLATGAAGTMQRLLGRCPGFEGVPVERLDL